MTRHPAMTATETDAVGVSIVINDTLGVDKQAVFVNFLLVKLPPPEEVACFICPERYPVTRLLEQT